jgi:hypothetical protein
VNFTEFRHEVDAPLWQRFYFTIAVVRRFFAVNVPVRNEKQKKIYIAGTAD